MPPVFDCTQHNESYNCYYCCATTCIAGLADRAVSTLLLLYIRSELTGYITRAQAATMADANINIFNVIKGLTKLSGTDPFLP